MIRVCVRQKKDSILKVQFFGHADYDVYDWEGSGISKGELYRILEELPKYIATGLIKDD